MVSDAALLPPGASGAFPPLSGMALVTAREDGRTLICTAAGAPLLVAGEYGRGRTAVFAGGQRLPLGGALGRRAPRRARFWLQLIFGAAPAAERVAGVRVVCSRPTARAARCASTRRAPTARSPRGTRSGRCPAPGEPGEPVRLERVGLRAFRGDAPTAAEGYRRVIVAEDRQGLRPLLTTGYRIPPAAEDLPDEPRWDVVERLVKETGGAWVDAPGELVPAGASGGPACPCRCLCFSPPLVYCCLMAEVVVRTLMEE